jgi:hypothetical protein
MNFRQQIILIFEMHDVGFMASIGLAPFAVTDLPGRPRLVFFKINGYGDFYN